MKLSNFRAYDNMALIAKELVSGFITGLHKSPYHGFSVEFAEHRIYNPGESTRHIDWKVYAKTDRLYSKVYEAETNLRAYLLLDASSSMYYPKRSEKLEFSVYGAAALAYMLVRQRDAVGLFSFDEVIKDSLVAKSTLVHLDVLFEHLEALRLSPKNPLGTNISRALHNIATRIPKRSLVILFSDLLQEDTKTEQLIKAFQHLRYEKHEVLVFCVSDVKTEEQLAFADRPHIFYHLEGKEKIKLNPAEIRQVYQKHMQKKRQLIFDKCGTMGVHVTPIDVDDDFDKLLTSALRRRTKMM